MSVIVGAGGALKALPPAFDRSRQAPETFGPSRGRVELLTASMVAMQYEKVYGAQPWIFICANKLARGIARLPLKAYAIRDAGGDRDRIREGALPELLEAPWPGGSAYDLKEFTILSRAVYGNALWLKVRRGPGQPPAELWPLPWRHIEVVGNVSGRPAMYFFHGERDKIAIFPSEVVHHREPGLGAIGVSPLEPLRRTIALEHAAQEWAGRHFQNAATPSGAFSTDAALKKETVDRLRAELERLYGGLENAGRFGIFDQGLKWQSMSHSAVDADLIDQRKLNREEAAAVYDIPPTMVGILDHATFSNVTDNRKSLYIDTLGPRLNAYEDTCMAQLIRPEPKWAGQFIEFDLSEVLKGDLEKRSAAYQRLLTIYTINEIRRIENLPPIDHPMAGVPLIPANMLPMGADAADVESRAKLVAALALLGPSKDSEPDPKPDPDLNDPESNGHRPGDLLPTLPLT